MSPADSQNPTQPPPAEVVVVSASGQRHRCPASAIRSHDFRQTGFLTPSELRRIRLHHEQFTRSLTAGLAIFLRLDLNVQLSKVQIVGYQKFTESLASPTLITLFRTEPLKGTGLLVTPPRLGLGLVDRLLGGAGQMPANPRELSEIELALADQIAMLLLTEWTNHWTEMKDLRPVLAGHESNSRFIQTAPPDTEMLILTLEAGLGEEREALQLAVPYTTVEPLLRQLSPPAPEPEPAPTRTTAPRWNPVLDEIQVQTSAQWQGLTLSTAQIAQLKPGDVLMMSEGGVAQVELLLSQAPKFLGQAGTCGGKWAVQLTSPVSD